MKLILSILILTLSLNASAYTFIGSLLENKKILEFISVKKEEGFRLTSVFDRLANEGLTEDQRGARGHYLIKLIKVDFIDTEEGDIERKITVKKFEIRTDFGRVQAIEPVVPQIETPPTENDQKK